MSMQTSPSIQMNMPSQERPFPAERSQDNIEAKPRPAWFKKISVGLAVLAAVAFGLYLRFIRPWQLRWGATDEEVGRAMPGDDVVKSPTFNATRAVTIQAQPEEIWPWLVQIGCTRAGMYSYDWLDNAGSPSAEHILPEYQHLAACDFIPLTPDGKQGMWVKAFEPNRWILWVAKKEQSTWLWMLSPQDEHQTCLITRLRVRYTCTLPWILYYLLQDVGDIVMMRKCLLGIKRRAEKFAAERVREATTGQTDTPKMVVSE